MSTKSYSSAAFGHSSLESSRFLFVFSFILFYFLIIFAILEALQRTRSVDRYWYFINFI